MSVLPGLGSSQQAGQASWGWGWVHTGGCPAVPTLTPSCPLSIPVGKSPQTRQISVMDAQRDWSLSSQELSLWGGDGSGSGPRATPVGTLLQGRNRAPQPAGRSGRGVVPISGGDSDRHSPAAVTGAGVEDGELGPGALGGRSSYLGPT